MAENNPGVVSEVRILNARGEEIKMHPVTPRQAKRSLRKKVAYGVAAVGAAATMIGAGIAIEKTGKFPFGATVGESSAVPAIARDVPPSETAAPAVVAPISTPTPISERAARKTEIAAAEARAAEAENKAADERAIQAAEERIKKAQESPKTPTPTATPTDKERKDAIVAENLGKEMAKLQFEYDKTHPSPSVPIATPTRASSGEKPGQGNEGGGPWGGLLSGSAITAVILGAAYRFRARGGRLITAVRNRFGGAGGAGGGAGGGGS